MEQIIDRLKSKFEGYKQTMETKCIPFFYKKNLHNTLFILLLITITALIFILNHLSAPWVADDFWKGQIALTFSSFLDWFNHIYNFYFSWGGRIWAELFAVISLAIPKSLFNILNTLVYMIVVLLIYFNILGKRKISVSLFLGINFSLFAFLPAFGQDILWITGSANYLWTSIILLSFLACWRLYYQKAYPIFSNPFVIIAIAILGFFTGWMNEHVSIATLFMLICFIIFYRTRDKKIPFFAIAGFICTLAGTLFLLLAPGNYARLAVYHSRSLGSFIEDVLRNPIALTEFDTGPYLPILFAGFLILGKSRHKLLACIYATTAIVCCMAYTAVGHISGRVIFTPIVFLIIAVGLLYHDEFTNINGKKFRILTSIFLLISTLSFFSFARSAIKDYKEQYEENVRIIEVSKAKGNLDVVVNPNEPKNRFCASYGLGDIQSSEQSSDYWINQAVARHFKLHRIRTAHISECTEQPE